MMEMGQKINNLRIEKGMTLEELGNKVGVGKSTVRKWENGIIANMKRDKILKIADALDTTPAYLMGWEDASSENIDQNNSNPPSRSNQFPEIAHDITVSDDLKLLLEMGRKMSPEQLKAHIEFMKKLYDSE